MQPASSYVSARELMHFCERTDDESTHSGMKRAMHSGPTAALNSGMFVVYGGFLPSLNVRTYVIAPPRMHQNVMLGNNNGGGGSWKKAAEEGKEDALIECCGRKEEGVYGWGMRWEGRKEGRGWNACAVWPPEKGWEIYSLPDKLAV